MPRDKVDVAGRANDAYNRGDVDGLFAELATPEFEWWPALMRAYEGGCYQGRDAVEWFVADTRENWEELIGEARAAAERLARERADG